MAAAAPVTPAQPGETLTRARGLKDAGDAPGAARLLESWLAANGSTARPEDAAVVALEAARDAVAAGANESARADIARLEKAETALPAASPLLAQLRREHARIDEQLGNLRQAERLLVLALNGAIPSVQAAEAANALGMVRTQMDQPRAAATAFEQSTALLGCDKSLISACVVPLANLATATARYNDLDRARDAATRSEQAAGDDPKLRLVAAFARAQILLSDNDPVAAEAALTAVAEQAAERNKPLRGYALYLIGNARYERGLLPEALQSLQAADLVYRSALGDMNTSRALVLDALGTVEADLGDDPGAALYFDRAREIAVRAFGEGSVQAARYAIERTRIDLRQGDEARAERRALAAQAALASAVEPNQNLEVGVSTVLGEVREHAHRLPEAAREFMAARDLSDAIHRSNTVPMGFILLHLGRVQTELGQFDAAQATLDRAVAVYSRLGGTSTTWYAEALEARAALKARRGDRHGALDESEKAFAILRQQIIAGGTEGPVRQSAREVLADHVGLLLDQLPGQQGLDEAFAATQLALTSRTGDASRLAAARLAVHDDALGGLLRQQEDVADRLRQSNSLLRSALLNGGADAAAEERRLEVLRHDLGAQLHDLSAQIADRFPRFVQFSAPTPVTVAELQKVLGDQEAAVMPFQHEDGLLLWVITQTEVKPVSVPLTRAQSITLTGRLRAGLDLGQDHLAPFDVDAARELYRAFITPIEGNLAGRRRLLVVADGALQSIPLSVLIDPGTGQWLVRRFAVAMFPSLSTLITLRDSHTEPSSEPGFLGVGNPHPGGQDSSPRAGTAPEMRSALQGLSQLPETRDELARMTTSFANSHSTLLLGNDATKANFAKAHPGEFKVLAFATHAVMAGELPGLVEPAIIVTPGDETVAPGLLMASEVASLNLDADLVLLSACNTAAPDGGPMAEGFSGLARAFLFAGARALLVSHWAVASRATVDLTTGFLSRLRADPDGRRAEALQGAMLAMLENPDPEFHHPAIWAPFVLVGE